MKKTTEELITYVAFLRGINVGGHKQAPMAEVKKVFEKLGFTHVGSILATGNIIFDAAQKDPGKILQKVLSALEEQFGFEIYVIIRTLADIKKMVALEPFKDVDVASSTRLYVTFFTNKPKSKIPVPYTSPDASYQILTVEDNAIFSVLDVDRTQTPDVMNILEKEYGKNITTRNWNTIVKIARA